MRMESQTYLRYLSHLRIRNHYIENRVITRVPPSRPTLIDHHHIVIGGVIVMMTVIMTITMEITVMMMRTRMKVIMTELDVRN